MSANNFGAPNDFEATGDDDQSRSWTNISPQSLQARRAREEEQVGDAPDSAMMCARPGPDFHVLLSPRLRMVMSDYPIHDDRISVGRPNDPITVAAASDFPLHRSPRLSLCYSCEAYYFSVRQSPGSGS